MTFKELVIETKRNTGEENNQISNTVNIFRRT
jgi:hypothetical protein